MKYIIISLLCLMNIVGFSDTITDVYDLTLRLKVPQVINNTESQGSRVIRIQVLRGKLLVNYRDGVFESLRIQDLTNYNFKVQNKYVTYDVLLTDAIFPRLNYIGNNKTGKFIKPTIAFSFDADPSYNKGEVDEDNTLVLNLAGVGSSVVFRGNRIINKLSGNVTGTLGCGCYAYGHTSPTRVAGDDGATNIVTDVAAVLGSFTARYNRTLSRTSIITFN